MNSRIQDLAAKSTCPVMNLLARSKAGCSEPTALIRRSLYEQFETFEDNDMYLSNLRKAADVLKVKTGSLLPK